MKLLLLALAFVALAECLPSPDAMVPEVALTQEPARVKTPAEHHQEAKATVQQMMETGSTSDACGELAESIIKEVEASVNTQQEALDAFKAPNDGTSCADAGQDAVQEAQKALEDGRAAATTAREAATSAASAGVELGTVSLAALSVHAGVVCSSMSPDEDPYQTAHANALVAAATATEKESALPGLETALEFAQAAAAKAKTECECNVLSSYEEAWTKATSHAETNAQAYTKGKHMKCVLAGTSDCPVGDVPAVTPITLAVSVSGDACTEAPTPNPTPNPTPHPTPHPTPNPTPHPTPHPTPALDNSVLKIEGGGDVGRLQIYHHGVWGTVCDDHFDSNNNGANVACRQMGYRSGVNIGSEGSVESHYNEGVSSSFPIWLDDAQCSGSESDLRHCPGTRWMAGSSGCAHSEDVTVSCSR